MSVVIRYIILNDKISCLPEHVDKLLFLYNYRSNYKLKWLIYAWAPLPTEIQKKIINIYNSTNLYLSNELIKTLGKEFEEIIKNTKKDINEKSFIKFLHDIKYINKNLLLLFTIQTNIYSNNDNCFVLNNQNKYLKITKEEELKIEKYKKQVDKHYFYTEISFNIKHFVYYIKELIKIKDEWWLITTCYKDKIEEQLESESEKIIYLIFSIIV